MAMRNLVLGSRGFIGKPLCTYLRSIGEESIEYDKKLGMDLRFHTDLDRFIKKNSIDRVYFLAWDVGGSKYLYDPAKQIQQIEWNTDILSNSMHQLKKSGVPFLFTSSQLSSQMSAYGATKRLGEVWTRLCGGMSVRLWNVWGPLEEPSDHSHVVSDIVWGAVKNKTITMLSYGTEERRFVHIDDVCHTLHDSFANYSSDVIYDVGHSDTTRIVDIIHELSGILGGVSIKDCDKPGQIQLMSPYIPAPWHKNTVSLHDGLERMVEELKRK